jgi:MraZ protein
MAEVNESEQDANFDNGLRFWLAASDADLDKQGRLALPSLLRKQADITTSAIIVGNGDRVEIWSPARWDQKYAEWVAAYKTRNDDFGAMRRSGLRP